MLLIITSAQQLDTTSKMVADVVPINYLVLCLPGAGLDHLGHIPDAIALAGFVLVVGAGLLSSFIGYKNSSGVLLRAEG